MLVFAGYEHPRGAELVSTVLFKKRHVKSKHARRGRNPQTGKEMILDARKVVTWTYSPVIKKAVNRSRYIVNRQGHMV